MTQQQQPVAKIKLNVDSLVKDETLSFTNFYKVLDVQGKEVALKDLDTGSTFKVVGEDLISTGNSASYVEETVQLNKSEIAHILSTSYNKPFTVKFTKADGTDRVLTGRLVHPEPLMGRSMVEDLDVEASKNRVRLVDHRTIQYLIVGGRKYETKD